MRLSHLEIAAVDTAALLPGVRRALQENLPADLGVQHVSVHVVAADRAVVGLWIATGGGSDDAVHTAVRGVLSTVPGLATAVPPPERGVADSQDDDRGRRADPGGPGVPT